MPTRKIGSIILEGAATVEDTIISDSKSGKIIAEVHFKIWMLKIEIIGFILKQIWCLK